MKKLVLTTLILLLNIWAATAQEAITKISLPEKITVGLGQTIDLLQYITVEPEGATLPKNLRWNYGNAATYISVSSDNKLTGVALTEGRRISLTLSAVDDTGISFRANTIVEVIKIVPTAISVKSDHRNITVGIDDTDALNAFLAEAYQVTPEGASGNVEWVSANENIVKMERDVTNNLFAMLTGRGTTTLTPRILTDEGIMLTSSEKVTVKVVQHVKDLYINSNLNEHECNVGDDLTSYLNSLVMVEPADADNRSVTWSIVRDEAIVSIDQNGRIKAVMPGVSVLKVVSNDNPQLQKTIYIKVHNPATDIRFASSTVDVEYNGSEKDISKLLKENISFLPQGYESIEGLTVTSSSPDNVVAVDNATVADDGKELVVTARAKGVGTATITVAIKYRDYIADYTSPATTVQYKEVSRTFTVNVTQGTIPVTDVIFDTQGQNQIDCNVGDDMTAMLNSRVKVLPDNATDKAYKWAVIRGDGLTVDAQGSVKAVKAGLTVLSVTSNSNPQATASVYVLVHNPATGIHFASETLSVEYADSPVDISALVARNIRFSPDGYDELGDVSVTSASPQTVAIRNVRQTDNGLSLEAQALAVGQSVVTVAIKYRDYIAQYASDGSQEPQYKTVSSSFTVNVKQGIITVASLRNTSTRQAEECNVGDDLAAHLNSLIEVLPANADDKSFTWSVAPGTPEACLIVGADGSVKAQKAGTAVLVATSVSNPQATATVNVLVHNPATGIHFAAEKLSVKKIEGIDEDISELLMDNISFLPVDFESVERLSVTSNHPNDVVVIDDVSFNLTNNKPLIVARAIGAGEALITVNIGYRDYLADYATPAPTAQYRTVSASFIVTVTEEESQIVSITYPDKLVLSRYSDVELALNVLPEGAMLNPLLVEFVIGESKNAGWGAAATVTPSDASSSVWNLRGRFAGAYIYKVYYNGQPLLTESGKKEGQLLIPVEYPFEHGWDWISLYAVGSSGVLNLKTSMGWIAPMELDDDNHVQEIRSQHELLYKDPELGFFGDIEQLRPEDGMYKIHSLYDNEVRQQMLFTTSFEGLLHASSLQLPQAHKGYTWITYPHELDHSLSVLAPYLSRSAQEGDMIIGRDGFALYDGEEWIGPNDFMFQAGKGYIYYTESNQPKTIEWGPSSLVPDVPMAGSRTEQSAKSPWRYDAYAYPDCMAILARIDGIDTPDDYAVGAFVGDECRGQGVSVGNELVCIAVSGQSDERVSFCLYHKPTGTYQTVDGSISFAARAGSLHSPVVLNVGTTGVSILPSDTISQDTVIYNISGQRLSAPRRGINIVNGKKVVYK